MALEVDEAWVRRYCIRHGFKDPLADARENIRPRRVAPAEAERASRNRCPEPSAEPTGYGCQRFVIFGRLMGLNEYTELNRANAYMGNKFKQREQQPIKIAIRQAGLKPVKRPVRLKYLWIEPDKRRDHDNVAFAQKFVQDALVSSGILPDDSWDWVVGFEHEFTVDVCNPRIEIEIVEV